MVYFDHAASTPVDPLIIDFYAEALTRDNANPSSQHSLGRNLNKRIQKSKESILEDILNLKSGEFELVFTSSATESNNSVIFGMQKEIEVKKQFSLFFNSDHPSLVAPHSRFLKGSARALDNVSKSFINTDFLKKKEIDLKFCGLVCLTEVNSVSGEQIDIVSIAKKIKSINPKIHIHVDGVQAIFKTRSELGDLSQYIDSYAFSGHKFGAPKGVAGLVLKKVAKVEPLLLGGGHQGGMRSSTVSSALVETLEKVMLVNQENFLSSYNSVSGLSSRLNKSLKENLGSSIRYPFDKLQTSPYINSFLIPGIPSDVIMRHLGEHEIFVSSGSACSAKSQKGLVILKALGISKKFERNLIRVSLNHNSSEADIEKFYICLKEVVSDLSFLS